MVSQRQAPANAQRGTDARADSFSHAGQLSRVTLHGRFSRGAARIFPLEGRRQCTSYWAPSFPNVLLACAPEGHLLSAISANPKQRPEEEQVLLLHVNRYFAL